MFLNWKYGKTRMVCTTDLKSNDQENPFLFEINYFFTVLARILSDGGRYSKTNMAEETADDRFGYNHT